MKHILTRFTIENMLDEVGHDIALINLFYRISNQPEIEKPLVVPFDKLLKFIAQEDLEASRYLHKIRSSIGGYGPKHSKVLDMLNNEGFDLNPYVLGFFNSLSRDMLDQHIQQVENLSIQKNEAIEDKLEELGDLVDDMKESNIKMSQFTEEVDQVLHELTLKHFPELFENGNECIEAYRSHLITTTLDFVEGIDEILNNEF